MKKCLAVLLALVLTLSFFTFTVSADDMEATPYALACAACRNRMQTEEEEVGGGFFKVQSCPNFDGLHLHQEIYVQTYWVCRTNGCSAYGIKISAGDPVYAGVVCGHS